jgi:hypothetical protein
MAQTEEQYIVRSSHTGDPGQYVISRPMSKKDAEQLAKKFMKDKRALSGTSAVLSVLRVYVPPSSS